MIRWLRYHRLAARDAVAAIYTAPVIYSLSILSLAIALALPIVGWSALTSVRGVSARFTGDPQITLYTEAGDGPTRVRMARTLGARADIKSFRFVPKEKALADLARNKDLSDLTIGLPENPLPDTYVILPAQASGSSLSQLQTSLREIQGVSAVQLDAEWVERLRTLARVADLIVIAIASLLGAATAAMVFNTVRLQVLTRTEEIHILSLVGATATFMRRPFLYLGAFQGALAGLVAVILAALFLLMVNRQLSLLIGIPNARDLPELSLLQGITTILCAGALGWLGALLASTGEIRKRLRNA